MSRNRSLWLHVRGQQCVPVSDVDLAQELRSGTLPSDSLVWIPGQRRWVQVNHLPGYRSPQAPAATAQPPVDTLVEGSRVPPTVVMTAASTVSTASQHRVTVPGQAPGDDVETVTDVTVPRVLLTEAVESLVGTPMPGRA